MSVCVWVSACVCVRTCVCDNHRQAISKTLVNVRAELGLKGSVHSVEWIILIVLRLMEFKKKKKVWFVCNVPFVSPGSEWLVPPPPHGLSHSPACHCVPLNPLVGGSGRSVSLWCYHAETLLIYLTETQTAFRKETQMMQSVVLRAGGEC